MKTLKTLSLVGGGALLALYFDFHGLVTDLNYLFQGVLF